MLAGRPRAARALAEVVCPVPAEWDAVLSEAAWRRWRHADVAAMTRAELAQERARVRLRLALDDLRDEREIAWLTERLRLIEVRARGR